MGNPRSVNNMLHRIGLKSVICEHARDLREAEMLILPGVGAFDAGMRNLAERRMVSVLTEMVKKDKTPILGICLGMQLFAKRSDEGASQGMGWIDAEVVRFDRNVLNAGMKVPHMGWNSVTNEFDSLLYGGIENPRFYFVHSFHLRCNNSDDILSKTRYGYEFVSAVKNGNIIGTQFHPEKSHKYGMGFLENFYNYFHK